ncbi:prosaposin [Pholidichthys leucotaenia]
MLPLILLFVSSAVATPLLGTEQCARGPPYWCKNVKTASLCGAVTHCQQNVWNKPQMKTVVCELCKDVLMVVGQFLKENATQEKILEYLEKGCQLIPDEEIGNECKEIVDEYYQILIDILVGEAEQPEVVCGAMGLCTSLQAALAKVQAQEQLVSNEIPQVDLPKQVSPFLFNIPGLLSPQQLPREESPEKTTPKLENTKRESCDVCESCKTFLASLVEQCKNDTFIAHLINTYESECDNLGPEMAPDCKKEVRKYIPIVFDALESMTPEAVCEMAGFCDDAKKSVPMLLLQAAKVVPEAKTLPAAKLVPATKVNSVPEKAARPVRDSPGCEICKLVVEKLDSMLLDNKTEEQVIAAVEKVCSILPETIKNECKDLIETYGPAIIELLVEEVDPGTICSTLGLCSNRVLVGTLDQSRFKVGGYCEVCKLAISYIDGILEKNATEDKIEEAVEKVCSFLPDAYQSQCDQLVEEYEPLLIQLILQMLDPDFVCMKLGACPEAVGKLLGTWQCSWGPKFWCKNMETARQCNAVAHCKAHVWV